MRRYRRNGTPIKDRKVYVVKPGFRPKVWEVKGYQTWEEVAAGVPVEAMMGAFDFEKDITIVMPGAVFSMKNLNGADLSDADLSGAKLNGSYLSGACLVGSYLRGANFRDACISGADLRDADLSGADLTDADLRFSEVLRANLEGANLEGAQIRDADLRLANLGGARRLPSDSQIPGWKVVSGRLERDR